MFAMPVAWRVFAAIAGGARPVLRARAHARAAARAAPERSRLDRRLGACGSGGTRGCRRSRRWAGAGAGTGAGDDRWGAALEAGELAARSATRGLSSGRD